MHTAYLHLAIAIAAEVIGTTALAASQQFTRPLPSALVVLGYGTAFYFLSPVVTVMPVGVVYALWAGLGVFAVALIGWIILGQRLDAPALVGLCLIVAGVAVIHLFSDATPR